MITHYSDGRRLRRRKARYYPTSSNRTVCSWLGPLAVSSGSRWMSVAQSPRYVWPRLVPVLPVLYCSRAAAGVAGERSTLAVSNQKGASASLPRSRDRRGENDRTARCRGVGATVATNAAFGLGLGRWCRWCVEIESRAFKRGQCARPRALANSANARS